MEIRLTYQEISELIEKKAGRSLPIFYGGDPHTVRVSYDVNVLFKSASVGLDLTVEDENAFLRKGHHGLIHQPIGTK